MVFLVEPNDDNNILGCDFGCNLGSCGQYNPSCEEEHN